VRRNRSGRAGRAPRGLVSSARNFECGLGSFPESIGAKGQVSHGGPRPRGGSEERARRRTVENRCLRRPLEEFCTFPIGEAVTDPATEAADRLAIHDLAYRYAAGVDRRDKDLFLSAFHPDATLTIVRNDPDGADQVVVRRGHGELSTIPELITRYDKTFHFVGNHHCVVSGDEATGEVYCTAHHLTSEPRGGTDHVMLIRYQDTYRRGSDGQWLIGSRRLVVDWTERHPVPPEKTD
jgi:ketosteroid isomerase-like protein